ncbi:SLBB domain-containing protein [Thalassococcus halodurans]|uniref:SLBB domain-containing protein n=2 Tax=Thalassococcus halodurans TaxID=373675 RepID=A0A1H5Z4I2_9RHOB|nr:SLBB domain-containing protein [Thalassococcus halodurans]
MVTLKPALLAALTLALPSMVVAGDYQLIVGDEVQLLLPGDTEPSVMKVDLDGEIRLSGLGGVAVSGFSLDQAEHTIETALADRGLYSNPDITIDIANYAHVTVFGDVARPGRYDFTPGMTVATALAMSGGHQEWGISKIELERAQIELESQRKASNYELATLVLQEAKLSAKLQDLAKLEPDISRIPQPTAVNFKIRLDQVTALFMQEQSYYAETLAFMEKEVGDLWRQKELFDQKLAVQNEILDTAEQGMARSKELLAKGLQTSTQQAITQQRYADARAKKLELEQAILLADRAWSDVLKAKSSFVEDRRQKAMTELMQTQAKLDQETLNYRRLAKQLALLSGGEFAAALLSEEATQTVSVQSSRSGRELLEVADTNLSLMPGDTVIISLNDLSFFDG